MSVSKIINENDLAIGVAIVVGGAYLMLKSASASGGKTALYGPIYSPTMRTAMEAANIALKGYPCLYTVNPNSGPSTPASRPDVFNNAKKLKADNPQCHVEGYIATGYGAQTGTKTIPEIKLQVDLWATWNTAGSGKVIDGIMWDEVQGDAAHYNFYKEITDYARSKGLTIIRGNPGVKPSDERFIQLFDHTSIHEGNTLVDENSMKNLTFNGKYPKSKFNYIAHSVAMSDSWFNMAIKYVGQIYLTDDAGANPYDMPSSYLNQEITLLKAQP